jgi:hypothetical protein
MDIERAGNGCDQIAASKVNYIGGCVGLHRVIRMYNGDLFYISRCCYCGGYWFYHLTKDSDIV